MVDKLPKSETDERFGSLLLIYIVEMETDGVPEGHIDQSHDFTESHDEGLKVSNTHYTQR